MNFCGRCFRPHDDIFETSIRLHGLQIGYICRACAAEIGIYCITHEEFHVIYPDDEESYCTSCIDQDVEAYVFQADDYAEQVEKSLPTEEYEKVCSHAQTMTANSGERFEVAIMRLIFELSERRGVPPEDIIALAALSQHSSVLLS
jgi:hypothetical protein